MSKTKRLKVFAGPNGSGKSTLFEDVKEIVPTGIFINSDIIEKEITDRGFINLDTYNLKVIQEDFDRFRTSENAKSLIIKSENAGHKIDVHIKDNIIVDKSKDSHSYEASLITSFIREQLYHSGHSFSFETVMSHESKLDEIELARESGYKVYLYFICLDDPDANISRIQNRVVKGGHDVDSEKVKDRYSRTLNNLLSVLNLADRAYLFDNSNSMELIAESHQGSMTIHSGQRTLPNWFIEYILNKL